MFEPKSFLDKRAAMNEILLQQLFGHVMHTATPSMKQHLQMTFEQHAKGQQRLKDVEADRVLGEVERVPGVLYATHETMLNYLMANVGRTYFGVENHTSAPDGSIGTSGFGTKFKDWLAALPDYDASIGFNMVSGFYRDGHTKGPSNPVPLLVLRNGNELITIVFNVYVSVMTLNLDHIPADYRWTSPSHQALRGELFSYRGDLSIPRLEEEMKAALATHGIGTLVRPTLPEVPESETVNENASVDEDVITRDFEADVARLSDPEIFDVERDSIHAHWAAIFDKQLADDPTKEIYDQKARLTIALFGPVDILEFEEWKEEHYEAHKQMIEAGDVRYFTGPRPEIDDSGMEREETDCDDIPDSGEESGYEEQS